MCLFADCVKVILFYFPRSGIQICLHHMYEKADFQIN